MEVPITVKYYDKRVSRVIKGFIKYGFKSMCVIILKILSINFSWDTFLRNHPAVAVAKISE